LERVCLLENTGKQGVSLGFADPEAAGPLTLMRPGFLCEFNLKKITAVISQDRSGQTATGLEGAGKNVLRLSPRHTSHIVRE